MKSFTLKERCLIGLTLFSMFFGAGNLIFPPFLGALAGDATLPAMSGFAVTAVLFPILGVAAVARSGGLTALGNRVHPAFAFLFTLLIYLSIGPCLAIPRTAGTSFEMAIAPLFAGEGALSGTIMGFEAHAVAQAAYSVFFFLLAFTIALNPDKLTQRLGKILSPTLLTLIAVLFIAAIVHPLGEYGAVRAPYDAAPFVRGFIEGYQTMDTLAALNFGLIIAMNIRALGVTKDSGVVRETIFAGFVAGFLLITVYAALAHIGAEAGGAGLTGENGAQTLTGVVIQQFGHAGLFILGAIFFIACLNTCVGLLSCCSNYFRDTFLAHGLRRDEHDHRQRRPHRDPEVLGPRPRRDLSACARAHHPRLPAPVHRKAPLRLPDDDALHGRRRHHGGLRPGRLQAAGPRRLLRRHAVRGRGP